MELKERYAAWKAHEEKVLEDGNEDYSNFAFRADGVMVCLEQSGRYFEIFNSGPGRTPDEGLPTDELWKLRDPVTGATEVAYIEPIWVAGYADCMEEF